MLPLSRPKHYYSSGFRAPHAAECPWPATCLPPPVLVVLHLLLLTSLSHHQPSSAIHNPLPLPSLQVLCPPRDNLILNLPQTKSHNELGHRFSQKTSFTMSGEAWLYLLAVLINAVNLFLQVFFTIMYSDLEW